VAVGCRDGDSGNVAANSSEWYAVSRRRADDRLQSAGPSTTTVNQVCARSALVRSSRVPAVCRQTVGVRPCDTLSGA
jgi:hypothetical protein